VKKPLTNSDRGRGGHRGSSSERGENIKGVPSENVFRVTKRGGKNEVAWQRGKVGDRRGRRTGRAKPKEKKGGWSSRKASRLGSGEKKKGVALFAKKIKSRLKKKGGRGASQAGERGCPASRLNPLRENV